MECSNLSRFNVHALGRSSTGSGPVAAAHGGPLNDGAGGLDCRAGDFGRFWLQLAAWGIQTGRVGAGLGDALVEALSPFDRRSLKLCWSGGSMVVGVDAVGGPPHRDVTDEGGAQRSARRRPCRLGGVVEGVVADVMGEVGDQLGIVGRGSHPSRGDR